MRVVGGAKSDRKLVRREGMEDLWRPDRGEVRGGVGKGFCGGSGGGGGQR